MKNIFYTLLILLSISACKQENNEEPKPISWESKKTAITNFDSLHKGRTYLPAYSHIYHIQEHRAFALTITASIRNISMADTVYILAADYYNTEGVKIRGYVKKPIYLKPLETLEIIIAEQDVEGGSGANFVFDWASPNEKHPPLFEAVMISTYGQQGISFTTRGVEVFD